MPTQVEAARRHGLDVWVLENEGLEVVILPAPGGKLVSIYDKQRGVEWLAPPAQAPAATREYGIEWDGPSSYGWDEMMPTIVACSLPGEGEAAGVSLPDHGELWTQPWQVASAEDGVTVRCTGRVLPYTFERRASLAALDALLLEYTVWNTGSTPLPYLWAAHPLFWCEPGAEIVLPPEIDEVVNVLPLAWGPEWGAPDTRNPWPTKRSTDGTLHLNRVRDMSLRAGRKFYVPPEVRVEWAGLWRPAVQSGLQVAWDASAAPYCGIWIDEGALYPRSSVVAIEPTNGYYDSLALAAANNRVATVAPGSSQQWHLTVRVGSRRPSAAW